MSLFDDGYTCDDPYDETLHPDLRVWCDYDNLTPEPPDGWMIVHGICAGSSSYEMGIWIGILDELQADKKCAGTRRFMICRSGDTSRFILVHPDLKEDMENYLQYAYSHQESCGCEDGSPGGRHIWRLTQSRAKRRFKMMSVEEALDFLKDYDATELAFEGAEALLTEENEDLIADLARD